MWSCSILQEEQCSQSENAPITLLMQALVSVVHGTSVSSLGSGIFTKVSWAWTVAGSSFCEGD